MSAVRKIAVRNGTKKRPQSWRVQVDGEEWRDVNPLVGRFLMTIATWGGNVLRSYNRAPSGGDGPADWFVVHVYDDNCLAELLDADPADLPITPHQTGGAMWADVHIEVKEEYARRFFSLAGGMA